MEMTLNQLHMKSVLAKNIDVKDTLDYALFGIQEPSLLQQFFLLGPIFSGLKTHHYFVGITTSGLAFVEVNAKYEERSHKFYKYYEIDGIEESKELKGKKLKILFKKGDHFGLVLPRVVLGLTNHEEDVEAAIRVIHEKIKNSKEYFKRQRPRNFNQRQNQGSGGSANAGSNTGTNQSVTTGQAGSASTGKDPNARSKNYHSHRRRKKRPVNKTV